MHYSNLSKKYGYEIKTPEKDAGETGAEIEGCWINALFQVRGYVLFDMRILGAKEDKE